MIKQSMYFRKGEIATILTIGAFLFIGVASLVSSFFINNKPRTTSTSAQTSNRCNPDIGNGMPCKGNEGTWCINCLSKTAPTCTSDQGVGIPFQCQGGVWKNMNTSGECNNTCAVNGGTGDTGSTLTSAPSPTGSGDNGNSGGLTGGYNPNIDGPGGNCSGGVGGADANGCGGTDGCRFWEQCANNTGCVDTTNGRDYYSLNPRPANACGPGVGSNMPIWTPLDLANYRKSFDQVTPTTGAGGTSPTIGASLTKTPTPPGNVGLTAIPTQQGGTTAMCEIGDGIKIAVGQERCNGTTRLICKINSTGKAVLGQEPDSAKCPAKECNQVSTGCYAKLNGAGIYTRYSDSGCTNAYSGNQCPNSTSPTVGPTSKPTSDNQLSTTPDKVTPVTPKGTSTTYTFTKDTTTTAKSCSSICASAGLSQLGVGTNGICSCGSSL